MDSIRLLQITSLLSGMVFKRDTSETAGEASSAAQLAVSQENRLAALDYSVLSGSQFRATGSFEFSWTQNEDGSATLDLSYHGNTDLTDAEATSEATSNFSLRLTITADGAVELPEEISVAADQIKGQDFAYTRAGVLQLTDEANATTPARQVDLSGKLDDDALALLKGLGLLDQNGKATQLLQFLSDFAGLDRFKAGQQVSRSVETSYGLSDKALLAQRQMLQSLKMLATMAVGDAQAATAENAMAEVPGGTAEKAPATGTAVPASAASPGGAPAAPPAAPAAAAPAAATASTAEDTLEALIETLEAALRQKEQQAATAQRAASQAAAAAARVKAGENTDRGTGQAEIEAAKALESAARAQQAAAVARLAVQNAKLQQQQLASQS